MAKDLYDHFDEVKELYGRANDLIGFDLAKVSFEGPEEELKQTIVTQPAIFVHSYALVQQLAKQNLTPQMTAGHSLGEYTALCTAGSLTFEAALNLVKIRGQLMQRAGEESEGTMAAIIGMESEVVNQICEDASAAGIVQVANYNSPGQLVISGSIPGVNKAVEIAKEQGAKRAVPLVVSGAFHSPLMAFAKEGLQTVLEMTTVQDAQIPVYANVTAQAVQQASMIKNMLVQQLTSPVRWIEIIQNMISDGVDTFYEVGPGTVLKGLLRRIDRSFKVISINNLDSLNQLEN